MGFATPYETWVHPLVRDGAILGPMLAFWFLVQLAAQHLVLPRIPGWKRFTRKDREDLIIRAVSVVNGFIMTVSAAVFVLNLYKYYDMTLPTDLYATVRFPVFSFFRAAITSYFAWDLITCFWYRWAWAWKIHAIASLLGTYTLMFPFSDVYSGFYTGCFEISNAFMHVASVCRLIASYRNEKAQADALNRRAEVCEYIFAVLFTFIRVIAGSVVTYVWVSVAGSNMRHDFVHRGDRDFRPKCHSELAYGIAAIAIVTIQLLQYVWFAEIVKRAMAAFSGGGAGGGSDKGKGRPTSRRSSQKRRPRRED